MAAFIRGINLGPNKRVGMAELRARLEKAGYEGAQTLLASGNVVLDTSDKPEQVERAVAKAVAEGFGHDVEVMARTAAEINAVVEANPYKGVATDGSKYFVAFLSAEPKVERVAEADVAPDLCEVRRREIYLWCPNGLRESRGMKVLNEKNLGVSATVRNWNTVTKVQELLTR